MSGEFLTITVAGNETKPFQKAGRYFEVISDTNATANIAFYGSQGNIVSNWNGVQSGFFSDDSFGAFALTNNSSSQQTFVVMICDTGKGGTRRQPGNVRVIDEITDAIQEYSLNPSLAVQVAAWTPMIAPATNTKGIIVRGYYLNGQANGSAGSLLLNITAAKSAPTGFATPSQRYLLAALYTSSANPVVTISQDTKINKFLPPGWGLYGAIEVQTGAAQRGVIQFDAEILT